MLEGQQIICFGEEWKVPNLLSKHRYMEMLAEQNDILYGNGLPVRAPRINPSDVAKILRRLKKAPAAGRTDIPARLTLKNPVVIPWHRIGTVRWMNSILLRRQVRRWMAEAGFEAPLLWAGHPTALPLVGRIGEKGVVYHLTDDYILQDGAPTEALRPLDEALARAADVVFVTSPTLLERKKAFNPHTYLVDHGVEFELFSTTPPEVPGEVWDIPRPIFGVHGSLNERLDQELLLEVTERRPDWSFVLVGDANMDISALTSRPNVYHVGYQPFERIPAFVHQFDVGMVPHRVYERTVDGNPIKVKEYLAAGLPVLAPDFPALSMYGDRVHIYHNSREFVELAERALAANTEADRQQRQEFVRPFSWRSNLEFMSEKIEEALARQ